MEEETKKQLEYLRHKVGVDLTAVNATLWTSCLFDLEKVSPITFGCLSLSLFTSSMILIKDHKVKKIKKENQKIKSKK